MIQLIQTFEKTLEASDYVNEEKPLTWLKCMDEITAKKVTDLTLREVRNIALSCKIKLPEIPWFLRFMNKVNTDRVVLRLVLRKNKNNVDEHIYVAGRRTAS